MPIASLVLAASIASPTLRLKPLLDAHAKAFHGRMGYWLKNLRSGETVGYDENSTYPSASTIKIAVMVEVFRQIEAGKLSWTDKLKVPDKRNDSMWLSYVKEGLEVNIEGLTNLMMNVSDNTATVMLANRLGVENIEKTLNSFGLTDTACTINVPATNPRLKRLREGYMNMGVTTPYQMATLLELIYQRKAASPDACDRMLRIMSHQYWDDFLESTVPPGIATFGKVGALNRSRSSVILVNGPTPYLLAIYTDNAVDQSWKDENEGHVAIRTMGSLVWNGLNPSLPYKPSANTKHYYPTGAGVE